MTGTYSPLYRSIGLPSGALRRLGTIHMHIDGAGHRDLVASLIHKLEAGGAQVKMTAVTQSVAGPQRREEPETYSSHTPVVEDQESLEYFSTSSLRDRSDAVRTLSEVIPLLVEHRGVVIETEHIVGIVDDDTGWCTVPTNGVDRIDGSEVGFASRPSLPYEIHHAIDFIPSTVGTSAPPIRLEQLLEETTALGIRVGGWFNFMKDDQRWSFRSNAFTAAPNIEELVMGQRTLLSDYLRQKRLECKLWTIVEQVLGIWRSPFLPLS